MRGGVGAGGGAGVAWRPGDGAAPGGEDADGTEEGGVPGVPREEGRSSIMARRVIADIHADILQGKRELEM